MPNSGQQQHQAKGTTIRQLPDSFPQSSAAPTLAQQVVAAIEERIRQGTLTPGDTLPSERELGRMLSVSRTVVRGAVADLSARGLLEAMPGGGYRVSVPSLTTVADSLSYVLRGGQKGLTYTHIHAVRRLLEVEIAGLAALYRTEADLAAMEQLLTTMERESGQTEAYCDADVAFHRALAVATQNPLFVVLLDAIADVLMEVRRSGTRLRGSVDNGLAHHRAIYSNVRTQDVEKARQAMLAHLMDSEAIQRRVAEVQS